MECFTIVPMSTLLVLENIILTATTLLNCHNMVMAHTYTVHTPSLFIYYIFRVWNLPRAGAGPAHTSVDPTDVWIVISRCVSTAALLINVIHCYLTVCIVASERAHRRCRKSVGLGEITANENVRAAL